MALHFSFFFLLKLLAENIFVLGVGLAEVIVAKALAELHIAAALAVAFDDQLDAPFDFRGWTLPAATKVLVVLNFELANVFFELSHFFVDGRHAEESPRFSNAKRTGRRIGHGLSGGKEQRCGGSYGVLKWPHGVSSQTGGFFGPGGFVTADSVGGRIAGAATACSVGTTGEPRAAVGDNAHGLGRPARTDYRRRGGRGDCFRFVRS